MPESTSWVTRDRSKGALSRARRACIYIVYTFCTDQKLALNFQQDPCEEFRYFIDDLHIGGLFEDFPATLTRFLARRGGLREKNWVSNLSVPWTLSFIVLCNMLFYYTVCMNINCSAGNYICIYLLSRYYAVATQNLLT